MQRRVTQNDIARHAGVSRSTVTFVLNERLDIAIPESTRDRVKKAAQELGYRPNAAARALVSGRMNALTIACPSLAGPYYPRLLQEFERMVTANGRHMILRTTITIGRTTPLSDLESVLYGPDDGVILIDLPESLKARVAADMPRNKPVVAIDSLDVAGLDCVHVHILQGARAAMQHLLAGKPKRLGLFGQHPSYYHSDLYLSGHGNPRLVAYEEATRQARLEMEVIPCSENSRREAMADLTAYVREFGCPDALFCYNDQAGLAAHRAMDDLGLRIPNDVRLVACDGIEEAEWVQPALSTIALPFEEMARTALTMVTARLATPDLPRQHACLDTSLVIRGSSALPAS